MGQREKAGSVVALCLALVLVAACSSQSESPAQVRVATATPDVEVVTTPSATATLEATPTPEEDEDSDEEPTPTPDEATGPAEGVDALLTAASAALDVPYGDACDEDDDCIRELGGGRTDASGQITRLAFQAGGGGGALIIMGRDGAGAWQLWMLTQVESYQLLDVPGQLRACSDASTLTVREAPDASAAAAGEVPHGEVMQASSFQLTEPGGLGSIGEGWYQVSGSVSGWVPATQSADASFGDCTLRNEIEREPGTRG